MSRGSASNLMRSSGPDLHSSHSPDPGRHVLIVGDPALGRGLLEMVLTRLGYHVVWLATGREAVMTAQSRPIAAILIALTLPDLSGMATARRLRAGGSLWASVPLILFGDAFDPDQLETECREARIDAYLPKPISIGHLVALMRDLTRATGPLLHERPTWRRLQST